MRVSIIVMAVLTTLAAASPLANPNANEGMNMEKRDSMRVKDRAPAEHVEHVDMDKRAPIQPVDPDDQTCSSC